MIEEYLTAKSTCKHCVVVLTIIALLYVHIHVLYLYNSATLYIVNDSIYSEGEPEETFPASRVISSQILGYDGGEVDSKEKVEVLFPVHVSLCFTPAII